MVELNKATAAQTTAPEELYLDLLKKGLTRHLFGEAYRRIDPPAPTVRSFLYTPLRTLLALGGLELVRPARFDPQIRAEGADLPAEAETMIGLRRLDNLQHCVTDVLSNDVPGDVIETGVWRGGAVIFMRAVLEAYGDRDRVVWAADSFEGVPVPDATRYPADKGDGTWRARYLAVSLDEVKANFARYGLLDDRVRFLPGWFRDTLPGAPIERLAVLRLDGDLYESTLVALESLYPKLSVGGYVIIDDAQLSTCWQAVQDFRAQHGITEQVLEIDGEGRYWQRLR